MSAGLVAQFEKRFPGGAIITAELQQSASEFSIVVLLGPSGCGKTTLLRCLAGLERPESGTIAFRGDVWFDARRSIFRPTQQRDIGFCFQEYALFPHLTVGQNVGYGLRTTKRERRRAVEEMLERFHLNGLGGRYPHQISGGQQQRVALARVLVRRPRLLLLDEPLSALDASLRDELRPQVRQLLSDFGIPVVLVTHDRTEAIALADRIVVMAEGRMRQSGSVEEVFFKPKDTQVARTVGIETIQAGEIVEVKDGFATVHVQGIRLVAVAPSEPWRQVHVCIKADDVMLQSATADTIARQNCLSAVVKWITPEGALVRVGLDCGFALQSCITRSTCSELALQPENRIAAWLDPRSIHLIPAGAGVCDLSAQRHADLTQNIADA